MLRRNLGQAFETTKNEPVTTPELDTVVKTEEPVVSEIARTLPVRLDACKADPYSQASEASAWLGMAIDAFACMTGREDDKLVSILSRVSHENFRNMIELARATIPDKTQWTAYSLLGDV